MLPFQCPLIWLTFSDHVPPTPGPLMVPSTVRSTPVLTRWMLTLSPVHVPIGGDGAAGENREQGGQLLTARSKATGVSQGSGLQLASPQKTSAVSGVRPVKSTNVPAPFGPVEAPDAVHCVT